MLALYESFFNNKLFFLKLLTLITSDGTKVSENGSKSYFFIEKIYNSAQILMIYVRFFMKVIKKYIKIIKDYFYDHPALRVTLEYLMATIGAFLSAFAFAFGYRAFVDPLITGNQVPAIVTGGASGIAQIVVKIFELCGFPVNSMVGNLYWHYLIQSASYVLINIPIFYLSFKKVGFKFGIFTILNVLFYFVIINYMPKELTNMFYHTAGSTGGFNFLNDLLSRSIFAGICTGLAAIISFKFDHSTGGIDAISVYVNGKRDNFSIGRVTLTINACIVIVYTVLCIINEGGTDLSSTTLALYSCIYFFTSSTVIDTFTKRDKKSQLQIITNRYELPDVLINYFPHSCTTVDGKGAYSKQDRLIIYTVISKFEVKQALKIIKEIDPCAFIVISNVNQVSGRFFIRPRK